MVLTFSYNDFHNELKSSLCRSTGVQRKSWAITIISQNIPITSLAPLLSCEEKVANRFLWLVSDVAIQNPERFLTELPALFDFMEQNHPSYLSSFASWWHYCGVPVENEARAIDLLFRCFLSAETNVSIKTRAMWVLVELSKKYPDLKQELKLSLVDQIHNFRDDKYSKDYKKRVEKFLKEMG